MSTDFGYENVSASEKSHRVQSVFSDVSASYDLMNDLMSFGLHRCWKDRLVERIPYHEGAQFLDVAGGTGDIALRLVRNLKKRKLTGDVYVLDATSAMIDEGQRRASEKGAVIAWIPGDAAELPFQDNTFDVYTIAFGLRNVTHKEKALKEAHRVLKPGGRFYCLEFSPARTSFLAPAYDFYSFTVLPMLGKMIAKSEESYVYLAESIRCFPRPQELFNMMKKAGLQDAYYEEWFGGLLALHEGVKE